MDGPRGSSGRYPIHRDSGANGVGHEPQVSSVEVQKQPHLGIRLSQTSSVADVPSGPWRYASSAYQFILSSAWNHQCSSIFHDQFSEMVWAKWNLLPIIPSSWRFPLLDVFANLWHSIEEVERGGKAIVQGLYHTVIPTDSHAAESFFPILKQPGPDFGSFPFCEFLHIIWANHSFPFHHPHQLDGQVGESV